MASAIALICRSCSCAANLALHSIAETSAFFSASVMFGVSEERMKNYKFNSDNGHGDKIRIIFPM